MSRRLLRSSALVSAMTMVSRVLGFVRDMVFANYFPVGPATDAFLVAFKIPNFLRRLFAEGAFSQAFVPVLSEYRTRRTHAEARAFVADVAGTLALFLLALTLVAELAAPGVVVLFAPGFLSDPQRFGLAADMLRITFPYLLLISLTALAGGVLNSYGRFAVPALTPVWLNISLIVAAVFATRWFEVPIVAQAWGVLAAGLIQLLFQLPFLARQGLLVWPRWGWPDSGVRRVIKLMLPALFGSSVAQVNLLLNTIVATLPVVASGSVTWLYFSDRLVEFPLGVFAVAIGTVILPQLSRHHAEASPDSFGRTLDWGMRTVLLIALPATVGLVALAGPLIVTMYQRGAFGPHDTHMSTLSLITYSLGLPAFALLKVLTPGFYARHDTRTPTRTGLVSVAVNMGFSLLVVVPLAYAGMPAPHAALALGTALAAYVNAGQLFHHLRRDGVLAPQPGWGRFALKLLAANGAMAALLLFGAGSLESWTALEGWQRAVWLAGLVVAGGAAYFACLYATGVRLSHFAGRHG